MVIDRRGSILLKGRAGLGNRILALLTAILYSRLANRRLMVDWRDGRYAEPGINSFPLLFKCRAADSVVDDLHSDSVRPWMWLQRLQMSAHEMGLLTGVAKMYSCPFTGELFSFDPARLDYQEEVLVMWSLIAGIGPLRRHLHGPWRSWQALADDAILARLLKENLDFHPEVEAGCAELQRGWPDRPKIGVHVRHTDRTTNLRRLRRRVEEMRRRHPDAVIVLATDSRAVLDDFLARDGAVLTAPKWLPESGPLHALRGGCPDRLAMARSALVDMRLLASCEHLIVNEDSTFSLVARLWWQAFWSADRACVRRNVRSMATLGWLPFSLRDRAWRSRDRIRCAPWLWRTRRRLRGLQHLAHPGAAPQ